MELIKNALLPSIAILLMIYMAIGHRLGLHIKSGYWGDDDHVVDDAKYLFQQKQIWYNKFFLLNGNIDRLQKETFKRFGEFVVSQIKIQKSFVLHDKIFETITLCNRYFNSRVNSSIKTDISDEFIEIVSVLTATREYQKAKIDLAGAYQDQTNPSDKLKRAHEILHVIDNFTGIESPLRALAQKANELLFRAVSNKLT